MSASSPAPTLSDTLQRWVFFGRSTLASTSCTLFGLDIIGMGNVNLGETSLTEKFAHLVVTASLLLLEMPRKKQLFQSSSDIIAGILARLPHKTDRSGTVGDAGGGTL